MQRWEAQERGATDHTGGALSGASGHARSGAVRNGTTFVFAPLCMYQRAANPRPTRA
jgi:hypothetical protein